MRQDDTTPLQEAAEGWNLYGWKWAALGFGTTVDARFMDLAFRIARNSVCVEGHVSL